MGNFFSKEESKSNVVENSSGASKGRKPRSVITSEDLLDTVSTTATRGSSIAGSLLNENEWMEMDSTSFENQKLNNDLKKEPSAF